MFVGDEASENMLASKERQELESRMKAGIAILCEAGCNWLQGDGTRLMPDNLESWMHVDVAFRELLAARRIDYVVCRKDIVNISNRVQFVLEQLPLDEF